MAWCALFGAMLAVFGINASNQTKINALVKDNEAWRQYNGAVAPQWECKIDSVDAMTISKVSWIWGIKPSLLAAIRLQENGRENREAGYNGKTSWLAENFEVNEIQFAEMARLVSKINMRYALASEKERHQGYYYFLASIYTGGSQAKIKMWARNVQAFEKMITLRSGYAKTRTASKALSAAGVFGDD